MDVPFVWIDVFAERALAGNPLPLVPDADELSDDQLRAIAREFNQSETTLLCRPTAPEADARLRSLTPAAVEVGGAGHNAMGAWMWLAGSGRLDPGRDAFVQQIGDELLPVRVSTADGIVRVTMEQSRPRFPGRFADREALAASLGLPVDGLTAAGAPVAIEQGRSLGRPSRIVVTVDGDRVALTGSGVVAAAGTLFL
ncbi:PhzF family phenazine biosynthesis protein [Leifsonia aquatica]|uniref:PhzF family phenazine biosynthesis protein n=1 Tax=Leifsonia aquatica TaxID=144185 RepID=UPI00384D5DE9